MDKQRVEGSVAPPISWRSQAWEHSKALIVSGIALLIIGALVTIAYLVAKYALTSHEELQQEITKIEEFFTDTPEISCPVVIGSASLILVGGTLVDLWRRSHSDQANGWGIGSFFKPKIMEITFEEGEGVERFIPLPKGWQVVIDAKEEHSQAMDGFYWPLLQNDPEVQWQQQANYTWCASSVDKQLYLYHPLTNVFKYQLIDQVVWNKKARQFYVSERKVQYIKAMSKANEVPHPT